MGAPISVELDARNFTIWVREADGSFTEQITKSKETSRPAHITHVFDMKNGFNPESFPLHQESVAYTMETYNSLATAPDTYGALRKLLLERIHSPDVDINEYMSDLYSPLQRPSCTNPQSYTIDIMLKQIQGKERPPEAIKFTQCGGQNVEHILLNRSLYWHRFKKVHDLKWKTHFERSRERSVTDLRPTESMGTTSPYLTDRNGKQYATLPGLNVGSHFDDVLRRVEECMWLKGDNCKYAIPNLSVNSSLTEETNALSRHIIFEQDNIFLEMNESYKLVITNAPASAVSGSTTLSEMGARVVTCETFLRDPFRCWFIHKTDTGDHMMRAVPNRIRLQSGISSETSCKETWLYRKPFFYCSNFEHTDLVPYHPAIGLRVKNKTHLNDIVQLFDHALSEQTNIVQRIGDPISRTSELYVQYFQVRNPKYESDDTIHRFLDTINRMHVWETVDVRPTGTKLNGMLVANVLVNSAFTFLMFDTLPIPSLREPFGNMVLDFASRAIESQVLAQGGTRADLSSIRTVGEVLDTATLAPWLIYWRQLFESILSIFKTTTAEEMLAKQNINWSWLYDLPFDSYIEYNGRYYRRVAPLNTIAYATQTQCCINIERGRTVARFKGYKEDEHRTLIDILNKGGNINIERKGDELIATAVTRYDDMLTLRESLKDHSITLVSGSERYEASHKVHIIPDVCPNDSVPALLGMDPNARRSTEDENEFAARAASIHPDIICSRVVDGASAGRQLLDALTVMNALEPLKYANVTEALGFGGALIGVMDAVQKMFGVDHPLLESIADALLSAFDWVIDGIKSLGPGDSLTDLLPSFGDDEVLPEAGDVEIDVEETTGFLGGVWDTIQNTTATAADMGNDALLEGAKQAVHATFSIGEFLSNPGSFLLEAFPDMAGWGETFVETIEFVIGCVMNPLQLIGFGYQMHKIFMRMYVKYDRDRLQKIRQHSLTHAAFVRYLVANIKEKDDINAFRDKLKTNEVKQLLTSHLIIWSQQTSAGFTSIRRICYEHSPFKCYRHSRYRCFECSKQTVSLEEATRNLTRLYIRSSQWGLEEDDGDVIRLNQRIAQLETELETCQKGK